MNRPGPCARLAGTPSGACAFLLASAVMLGGVYIGELPWWLVFVALYMASGTINSLGQMRAYNAWAGAWQELAGEKKAPPKKKKNTKLDVAVGLVAVFALPWLSAQVDDIGGKRIIALTWLAVCLGLLFVGVRDIVRRSRRATALRKAAGPPSLVQAAPVAWLMSPASSSPSRADAMRQLPEYSGRLISRG